MALKPLDKAASPRARTLEELGRLAGVSTSTASRALAESPLVSAKTRERVKSLALAHDFRPNQVARRLRTGRSGLIGIVVPLGHETRQHISDPFFMAMLGHLADGLTENGRDILLSRVIPTSADWLERIVDSGMIDGVVLIGQSNQQAVIERVAAHYRPMVVWGNVIDGQTQCAIGSDNHAGGRLAAEHLVARGSRRIVFLGDTRAPEIAARHAGARAALAEMGLEPPALLPTSLAADAIEADLARHVDADGTAMDGIIAASDVVAIAAVRVLADKGIAVPGAVRVVGYDDLPLATQMVPRLSTVHQDIQSGAALMIETLFRRIEGEDTPSVRMPPRLIARESS